ncbi:MAG: hypothetical protein LBG91_02175 [Treponema sp.]|jgi:hypothetical protein|nr:hypothetical protein [Treponema sp.]
MKRHFYRFLTITFLLLCTVVPLSAAETNVEFTIRFFDRRIYYVETDPVYVQITITNNGPSAYRFKLADERAFSVDFDVRTVNNRSLEAADILVRKRTQMQQVFFREITVENGESFSFIEDLRDYVNLKQPGSYIVRAKVYPELYQPVLNVAVISPGRTTAQALESNRLNLNLRPPAIPGPDGIPLEMDVATGAVLVRQPLAPDQVVEYMLTARQESQWEKFFLYLDLEAMLSRDAFQKRRWLAENEDGRRRMVAEYRRRLQNSVDDGDISVIPTKFEIEQTRYTANTGTVAVLEKFRGASFTTVRRYIYHLERRDNIWFIVDYAVESVWTEANKRQ